MIDDFSTNQIGWARFSDDRMFRYRLARSLTGAPLSLFGGLLALDGAVSGVRRTVFLMLNPSDADAFEPDPTVSICTDFATLWGCDVLEVVNLFALVSSKPAALHKRAHGMRGDDAINNEQILAACCGAQRVVAAWGNSGNDPKLGWRANFVMNLLLEANVELLCLERTDSGAPKHPHARGKHRIPRDRVPTRWP